MEAIDIYSANSSTIQQTEIAIARNCEQDVCRLRQSWIAPGPNQEHLTVISACDVTWMLGAQAAILNKNLKEAILNIEYDHSNKCNSPEHTIECAQFYLPHPGDDARQLWETFVKTTFPVHVFTLNPQVEEENVYDSFSRSRDLQLAVAFALASGKMNASQALKFSRKLTLDMATIALNRTAVAFAHDDDTWGWYFHPRAQTPPPERNNLMALGRMIWSTGPILDYDLNHRKIEPGIRDEEVLVVMPSFVPHLRLDVTTNWERIRRPGLVTRDYEDMIDQGARVQRVKAMAEQVSDQGCYRQGDYELLRSRVEQLDKMLPLQTQYVRIPFQSELPGSALIDSGKVQLVPEVYNYYGLEYLSNGPTTDAYVFINGRNFHPTLTRVISGGTESFVGPGNGTTVAATYDVQVMSRELIRVHIKPIPSDLSGNPVQVRVATPAGISKQLLIPLAPGSGTSGYGYTFGSQASGSASPGNVITISYGQIGAGPTAQPFFVDAIGPVIAWKSALGDAVTPIQAMFSFPNFGGQTLPICLADATSKQAGGTVPPGPAPVNETPTYAFRAADIRNLGLAIFERLDLKNPVPASLTSTKVMITSASESNPNGFAVQGVQALNQVIVNFTLVPTPAFRPSDIALSVIPANVGSRAFWSDFNKAKADLTSYPYPGGLFLVPAPSAPVKIKIALSWGKDPKDPIQSTTLSDVPLDSRQYTQSGVAFVGLTDGSAILDAIQQQLINDSVTRKLLESGKPVTITTSSIEVTSPSIPLQQKSAGITIVLQPKK